MGGIRKRFQIRCFVFLAVCFLAGLCLPEKRILAAGDGIQESLDYLNQVDAQQYANLDGLVITQKQYEEIRAFTQEIIRGADTDAEKIKIIYSFITSGQKGAQNPNYVLQAGETENDAYPMFSRMAGICYGFANLCRAMCTAADIPCINVGGSYCLPDGSKFGHAWNLVFCDGKWCFLDGAQGKLDLTGSEELWQYYDIELLKIVLTEENGYQITYDEGLAVVGYTGDDIELVVPEVCRNGEWTITSVDCLLPEGNIGGVSSLIRQGVESLTLPETVTNILNIDSVRTESLREIAVDSGNPVYSSYGGVLYNKEGTEILYIPFGLETLELKITGVIEKNVLYGLKNLKVLKFAEGTTELQGWAVENCENLEKVYIPESVKHIDSQAFAGCGTGFIIYAPEGSAGVAFAEENGIETKVPSEPEPDEKETEPGETETEPDETEPKPGETETKPGETESGKTEPTPGENGTSQTGQKTEEPGAVSETVKLKKVTKLKVTYKANKKIVLSWKKVQEADGYEIYRLQGKRWVRIKRTVKKVRVTIAKGSARKYRYKVRAYKKSKRGTLYGAFSKKLRVKKK